MTLFAQFDESKRLQDDEYLRSKGVRPLTWYTMRGGTVRSPPRLIWKTLPRQPPWMWRFTPARKRFCRRSRSYCDLL
ncbi:MAG: hypothetical protein IIA03_08900 [Proteobacteria bacterium]|nr:hypothetical protein [Pseudomonadota bacterium]